MTGNHEKLLRSSLYGKPHKHRYRFKGRYLNYYIFKCRHCRILTVKHLVEFWVGR